MGLILSRFRRKETTIEILEGIDKEISRLQKNRKENQDKQKRIATSLVIYSVILYILSAVVFFLLYFPDTWPLRLLYSLPLLAFPFLIWGLKKLLHWYFVKRIHGNDLALRDLREGKKQILEDVMETETYKKAKEILEKFDPARFRKLESNEASFGSGSISPTSTAPGLHHRKPTSQPSTPRATPASTPTPRLSTLQRPTGGQTTNPFANTPLRAPTPAVRAPTPAVRTSTPIVPSTSGPRLQAMQQPMKQQMLGSIPNSPAMAQMPRGQVMGRGLGPPGPPMPRSVLPRDRGTMDRLMDYFVGDGPENRYALICSHCSSHNGMALKEEFEYLSFRCCYCYIFNPARKQRPMAPRLEFFTPGPSGMKPLAQDESDEEYDDDEDDDEGDEEDGQKTGKGGTASAPAPLPSSQHQVRTPAASARGQQIPVKMDSQKKQGEHKPGVGMHAARPSSEPTKHAVKVNAGPKPGSVRGAATVTQQSSGSKSRLSNKDPQAVAGTNSNSNATSVDGGNSQSLSSVSNAEGQNGDSGARTVADDQPFSDDPHSSNDWEILGENGQISAQEHGSSIAANSGVSKEVSSDHPDLTDSKRESD